MTVTNLPVIDIGTGWDQADNNIQRVAAKIYQAATEIGFFYVCDHSIDAAETNAATEAARRFFDFPLEQKQTISVNQLNRGFMAMGNSTMHGADTYDLKEVLFWGPDTPKDDPDLLAGHPLVGKNRWPSFMPDLRSAIYPYYQSVLACGIRILQAIAVGLGLEQSFFQSRYHNPLGRGQLVYYPPQADERYGVAPHTDFGCITLLLQDSNGGLEVRGRDGEWIDAPPLPDTLVVNIGDLLQRWSNNRLISTEHRVINRSGNKRHSIAIFCDPDSNAVIDARDMELSRDELALYEPITAGEYIMSRNQASFAHYAAT